MQCDMWNLIVDKRFKYNGIDPKFHKVFLQPTENFPNKDHLPGNHCILAARFKAYLQSMLNYDVRSDDVWIISYPRSGTTWTQEMVWLINNDYDFQKAQSLSLTDRSPTLKNLISNKFEVLQTEEDHMINFDSTMNFSPPFHIKHHLPAAFLPYKIWTVKPKIIYVARNPKDAAISFYHFHKMMYQYEGTQEDFLNLFLEGLIEFGPQTSHILDFWNLRNEENVLFLTFEDMKNDLRKVIGIVVDFLGKSINDSQLEQLYEYLQLSSMRERATGLLKEKPEIQRDWPQQFFRQGQSGSYKMEMDKALIEKFDDLIKRERTMKGCNLYD